MYGHHLYTQTNIVVSSPRPPPPITGNICLEQVILPPILIGKMFISNIRLPYDHLYTSHSRQKFTYKTVASQIETNTHAHTLIHVQYNMYTHSHPFSHTHTHTHTHTHFVVSYSRKQRAVQRSFPSQWSYPPRLPSASKGGLHRQ